MTMFSPKWFVLLLIFCFFSKKGYDYFATNSEQSYRVVSKENGFQVREYGPSVFASVYITGALKESLNTGFRSLAAYIFAKGATYQPIPMTAPVLFKHYKQGWIVRFVLPEGMTQEKAPVPRSKRVRLSTVDKRKIAVLSLAGAPALQDWKQGAEQLKQKVAAAGFAICSQPWFARYNPPWIPPFMRRNEVMISVK